KNIYKYRKFQTVMQNLKRDVSIRICPADKGNSTVILDAEDYERKVLDHLEDANYISISSDPTTELENEVKIILRRLYKLKRLRKKIYNTLQPYNPSNHIFYGLQKNHKDKITHKPQ